MKTKSFIKLLIPIFTCLLIFQLSGCKKEDKPGDTKTKEKKTYQVKTIIVEKQSLENSLILSGWIEPYKEILISAEVSGILEKKLIKEGQTLQKDDLCFEIDPRIYEQNMIQAKAGLELAESNFKRFEKLFEKKMLSPGQMDEITSQLKQARSAYQAAKITLSKTKIKSPLSGYIQKTFADQGELVAPGTPLVSVLKMDQVYAYVSVPESEINSMKLDQKVNLYSISMNQRFEGYIEFISQKGEGPSKTFLVKVLIDNKESKLKAGMIVECQFFKPKKENVILIPQTALLSQENRRWVFIEKDQKVFEREVEIGDSMNQLIEIIHGLNVGENLVTHGQQNVIDGDTVTATKGMTK